MSSTHCRASSRAPLRSASPTSAFSCGACRDGAGTSPSEGICQFTEFCDNAVEGIYQSTPDGRYLRVNPALAQMYGYDSPAQLLRGVHDIGEEIYVDPRTRERFRSLIEQHGFVRGLEYAVRRRDGRIIWISEYARVVRDRSGRVLHYEGTIHDITSRREAEEAKEALEAQLRQSQKMEAIGTLAGGIAHDFNNLLAAIKGFTELAMLDSGKPEQVQAYLSESLAASARAGDLVRQILSFSRKSEEERMCLRLGELVREVSRLLRAALPSNVECRVELQTEEDWVLANPTQLHQVLLNLCSNAGYAMRSAGGSLTLLVSRWEGPLPEGLQPGSYLCMAVRDTGPGIAPQVLERMFDPFFTTKPAGEGTGLGLSVAMGVVRGHGGHIQVESRLGEGACFQVLLPAGARGGLAALPPPRRSRLRGRGHILCVDDEEMVLHLFQRHCMQRGYRVTTRAEPSEALRTLAREPGAYDLVITDLTMPGMSGLEFTRKLRALLPEVPVVLCTGQTDFLSLEQIAELDFLRVVPKPIDFDRLFEAVDAELREGTGDGLPGMRAAG